MSASEQLERRRRQHERVLPIFLKTGPKHDGADAFTRARDVEAVMDALPELIAVVKAAEQNAIEPALHEALAALDRKLEV